MREEMSCHTAIEERCAYRSQNKRIETMTLRGEACHLVISKRYPRVKES